MDELTFATGPVRLGIDGTRMRTGLQSVLTKGLGMPVNVVAVASYADLLAQLAAGTVHLAWMSPGLGVHACDKLSAAPLVSAVRAPGPEFYGTLFVRDDSPITTAEQVRGTHAGWVDPYSCSGYLFPRMALKARGFDLRGFFANQHMFGSHDAVCKAVESGAIEVGATYLNISPAAPSTRYSTSGWSSIRGSTMRPILRSEPIPSDMVVAHRRLPEELKAKATATFTAMRDDDDVVRIVRFIFGAERFEPIDIARYEIVRRALSM